MEGSVMKLAFYTQSQSATRGDESLLHPVATVPCRRGRMEAPAELDLPAKPENCFS
jgi:hypothetical protein